MLVENIKMNKEEVTVVSSLDIAETFDKRHADILRDIEKTIDPTSGVSTEFTERNFALSKYSDKSGKSNKMYYLTKDGFILLAMSYTGEKAMKFKESYIKQFNSMQKLLTGKLLEREKGIAIRQALTKALQMSNENDRMHGHAYSTYTNIIYKTIFGKDAAHLREYYGIGKNDNIRDCLNEEDLKTVQNMEMLVSGLVGCGWGYDQIKSFIQNNQLRIAA